MKRMKRIFLSADMEGTCGIVHWDETGKNKPDYTPFAQQMTREAAAACEGAIAGGAEDMLVKDAHDSARNINPAELPEQARIFRGWAGNLLSMMAGLDESFSGVFFTGYHSAAGISGNPLSHTMNTQNVYVKINGQLASELMINSLTAAMLKVPVLMVTGDRALCDWITSVNPNILTVPVNEGTGRGAISIHPNLAVKRIRETAQKAVTMDASLCMFPMPDHFTVEICYKEHATAFSNSFYPGCVQTDTRTVRFETDKYMEVLRFFHFCL
jgi:D-amino peptidase